CDNKKNLIEGGLSQKRKCCDAGFVSGIRAALQHCAPDSRRPGYAEICAGKRRASALWWSERQVRVVIIQTRSNGEPASGARSVPGGRVRPLYLGGRRMPRP